MAALPRLMCQETAVAAETQLCQGLSAALRAHPGYSYAIEGAEVGSTMRNDLVNKFSD